MRPRNSVFGTVKTRRLAQEETLTDDERKALRREVTRHYNEYTAAGGVTEHVPGRTASRLYKPCDLWRQPLQ